MEHVGIDLGASRSAVCLVSDTESIIKERDIRAAKIGMLLAKLSPRRIAIERGPERSRKWTHLCSPKWIHPRIRDWPGPTGAMSHHRAYSLSNPLESLRSKGGVAAEQSELALYRNDFKGYRRVRFHWHTRVNSR